MNSYFCKYQIQFMLLVTDITSLCVNESYYWIIICPVQYMTVLLEFGTFFAKTSKWTSFTIHISCMQCYRDNSPPNRSLISPDTNQISSEYMTSKLASLFGFRGEIWLHPNPVFSGVCQICQHILPHHWASGV
jgi:hypothetical protein